MKYDFELLKAEIINELENLHKLEGEFSKIKDKLKFPAEKVPHYDRGAIGYILHSFYNGCENIFRTIAQFFENDLGPQNWHRDLLKRMKLEIPRFRPRLIDDELYRLLDDFRAFRHKFRYSYSFELDWEREKIVAKKMPHTMKKFERQVNTFLKKMEQLDKAD